MPSSAAVGGVLIDPGGPLFLRDMPVPGGVAGSGVSGVEGAAGQAFVTMPGTGMSPRAAVEDASHRCIDGAANVALGGAGGTNRCDGVDTSGGVGGAARCPTFAAFEGQGNPGTRTPMAI